MCGGAIISDLITPSRSSRRLTPDLVWGAGADLYEGKKNNKKKSNGNGYSRAPLRSKILDLEDDFETDFQYFKDNSDDDVVELEDVKPPAFSAASKHSGPGLRGRVHSITPLLLPCFWENT